MTTFNADNLPRYVETRINLYQRMVDNPVVTRAERILMEGVIADMQTILDTLEATE